MYDRSYVVKSDNNFNITVESIDKSRKNKKINLTLKEFEEMFNVLNGYNLSYFDEYIQSSYCTLKLEHEKLKLEHEKELETQKLKEEIAKLKARLRMSCLLEEGDVMEFGKNAGNALKWRILQRDDDDTVVIMLETALKRRKFSEVTNEKISWENSSLRKWLNHDFLYMFFDKEERNQIDLIDGDSITLLTYEQSVVCLSKEQKTKDYWTRTVGYYNSVLLCNGGISKSTDEHQFWIILKYKF